LPLRVTWVVPAAAGVREREAVRSAAAFLKDIEQITLVLRAFGDGRELLLEQFPASTTAAGSPLIPSGRCCAYAGNATIGIPASDAQ